MTTPTEGQTPGTTEINITFFPDVPQIYINFVIEQLGLVVKSNVDNVLVGTVNGEVNVGLLGSGPVSLEGKDVGVYVAARGVVTNSISLYAKLLSSILVNGVEKKTW